MTASPAPRGLATGKGRVSKQAHLNDQGLQVLRTACCPLLKNRPMGYHQLNFVSAARVRMSRMVRQLRRTLRAQASPTETHFAKPALQKSATERIRTYDTPPHLTDRQPTTALETIIVTFCLHHLRPNHHRSRLDQCPLQKAPPFALLPPPPRAHHAIPWTSCGHTG